MVSISTNFLCGLRGALSFEKPLGNDANAKSRYIFLCIHLPILTIMIQISLSIYFMVHVETMNVYEAVEITNGFFSHLMKPPLYTDFKSQNNMTMCFNLCTPKSCYIYQDLMPACVLEPPHKNGLITTIKHTDSDYSWDKTKTTCQSLALGLKDFFWMGHRDEAKGGVTAVWLRSVQFLHSRYDFVHQW